jgi:hypothetical protein
MVSPDFGGVPGFWISGEMSMVSPDFGVPGFLARISGVPGFLRISVVSPDFCPRISLSPDFSQALGGRPLFKVTALEKTWRSRICFWRDRAELTLSDAVADYLESLRRGSRGSNR